MNKTKTPALLKLRRILRKSFKTSTKFIQAGPFDEEKFNKSYDKFVNAYDMSLKDEDNKVS